MAIGTPTAIGTATATTSSTPAITTTGAVPSDALAILLVGWGGDTVARTISGISGGGLSWAVDKSQAYAGDIPWGFAVCTAQAPAGMASSTTITVTLTGGVYGTLLAACYCTGLDITAPLDISDGNGATGSTSWDTTATSTTFADTLIIGGAIHDGSTTNTPTGGASELADWQYATESWTACVEYKILSSATSASLTGTWASGTGNTTSAFAAYKAAAAEATGIPDLVMAPPIPT